MTGQALPRAEDFECAFTTRSPAQTLDFGERAGRLLRGGDIVLLHGPLGAGKTCFVQGACRALRPRAEVVSPTFTLVNTFPGEPTLHHLDFFRVQEAADLTDIGIPEILDEVLDGRAIALVEWPGLFLHELGEATPCVELLVLPGATPDRRRWHGRGRPRLPAGWRDLFARLAADKE